MCNTSLCPQNSPLHKDGQITHFYRVSSSGDREMLQQFWDYMQELKSDVDNLREKNLF